MGWNKKLQNLTCLKVWFRQVQIAGPRFCAISQMPPLPAQSNIEHFVESMDWWTGNYQTAISKLASSARYSWSFDLALDPDHNLWSLIPRLDPDPEHFPFLLILEWRIYHIWQTQGVCTLGRVYVRAVWKIQKFQFSKSQRRFRTTSQHWFQNSWRNYHQTIRLLLN